MADELNVNFQGSAATLYAIIRRASDTYAWNGSAFEAWSDANVGTYDIPLTDKGGDFYSADFPSAIVSGDYSVFYYEQAGGSPATTDLLLDREDVYWDGATTSEPPAPGESGTYWTWDGIKNILGQINAEIASQLDNETTDADLARVAADGAIADAYVNWWASQNNFVTPVANASANFSYLQYGANLYVAGLLIAHREWFEIPQDQREQYRNVLNQRADEVFKNLFGPKPTGTDAAKLPDTDTTPPAGTFEFVPINRGTSCSRDEYSTGCW